MGLLDGQDQRIGDEGDAVAVMLGADGDGEARGEQHGDRQREAHTPRDVAHDGIFSSSDSGMTGGTGIGRCLERQPDRADPGSTQLDGPGGERRDDPLQGDQNYNVQRVVSCGFGEIVETKQLSEAILQHKTQLQ